MRQAKAVIAVFDDGTEAVFDVASFECQTKVAELEVTEGGLFGPPDTHRKFIPGVKTTTLTFTYSDYPRLRTA